MPTEALASLPLFAGLGANQLARLGELFELVAYPAGSEIFVAGDRASRLYIVRSGEVLIRYQPYDGGSLDIATIQPGGAFGWSAALKRSYYTSSALARTEVQVLTIDAHDLHQIMAEDPEIGSVLLERAALIAGSRLDSLGRQVIELLQPQAHKKQFKGFD